MSYGDGSFSALSLAANREHMLILAVRGLLEIGWTVDDILTSVEETIEDEAAQ